jgi:class 3 adenylate cyclase
MAIFGAPLPLADAGCAAVQAALDMLEMIELYNREPDRAGKPPIEIGIGIASGDVIAGYTGTQQRATYTCVGDAVNLAARLEAHTKTVGRTILTDAATRHAVGDRCRIEALGMTNLKGKAGGIEVYSVIGGQKF